MLEKSICSGATASIYHFINIKKLPLAKNVNKMQAFVHLICEYKLHCIKY